MITTNVLARGFDHLNINMVIHYDIPRNASTNQPDYDSYIHRVGRTGRFGRTGVSICFVHDFFTWECLNKIQQHFQFPIHVVPDNDISVGNPLPDSFVASNGFLGSREDLAGNLQGPPIPFPAQSQDGRLSARSWQKCFHLF